MNFQTSKNLSGIGALLMFLGALTAPFATVFGAGAIGIVGLMLLLAGLRSIALYYKSAGIFNNALYGGIAAVAGAAASLIILLVVLLDLLSDLGISLNSSNISNLSTQISSGLQNASANTVLKFVGFMFLDIVVLFVFILIATVLLRRSLNLLSAKTGAGLFRTTGTVMFVGGALTIVLLGLILVWISLLMLTIAFFQLRPPPPQSGIPQNLSPMQV